MLRARRLHCPISSKENCKKQLQNNAILFDETFVGKIRRKTSCENGCWRTEF